MSALNDSISASCQTDSTDESSSVSTDADIIIVGAGLVGTPMAHVLAAQGWSVVLIDAKPTQAHATDDVLLHQRCTAINLGTMQWLERQGLWHHLASEASAIDKVLVSQRGYLGSLRLNAKDVNADALGFVVSNHAFSTALTNALAGTRVRHIPGSTVKGITISEHSVEVSYLTGDEHRGDTGIDSDDHDSSGTVVDNEGQTMPGVSARLLIAADGVKSPIRRQLGLATREVDYDQQAVLGMVSLAADHNNTAYERFTHEGPLALLPRPNRHMSFVECIDSRRAELLRSMSDQQYLEHLQQRFGYRLGRFQAVGPRSVVPLVRIEATQQTANRTILLGNAMRLLHPVGGQGFNLAVRDMATLADVLCSVAKPQPVTSMQAVSDKAAQIRATAVPDGSGSGLSGRAWQHTGDRILADPGSQELLRQFVAARAGDQRRIVSFTDLLARGFRGQASLPAHIRSLGLIGLDTLAPARRRFADLTMGLMG